jgi:hypothetical protein
MPRVDRESRRTRDALILRLFVAGLTHRQIGAHPQVQLSQSTVTEILHRELAASGPAYEAVRSEARTVFLMRSEQLLKAAWPKAMKGDIAAVNVCVRVVGQQARIYGLVDT